MATTTALPTLPKGDSGTDVTWAQYLLVNRGLVYQQVDGQYGDYPPTTVILFQNLAGLNTDGVVAPLTWAALGGNRIRPPTLSEASHGPVVSALQTALNNGRGSFSPNTDPVLVVDGEFGPRTAKSVRGTQQIADVASDGVVGLQTWAIPVNAASQIIANLRGVSGPGA